jgi:hypothetical protein
VSLCCGKVGTTRSSRHPPCCSRGWSSPDNPISNMEIGNSDTSRHPPSCSTEAGHPPTRHPPISRSAASKRVNNRYCTSGWLSSENHHHSSMKIGGSDITQHPLCFSAEACHSPKITAAAWRSAAATSLHVPHVTLREAVPPSVSEPATWKSAAASYTNAHSLRQAYVSSRPDNRQQHQARRSVIMLDALGIINPDPPFPPRVASPASASATSTPIQRLRLSIQLTVSSPATTTMPCKSCHRSQRHTHCPFKAANFKSTIDQQ